MSLDLEVTYAKPRSIEQLDGRIGLTSLEICKSIGVSHHDFKKELGRRQYLKYLREAGFLIRPFSPETRNRGRKPVAFAIELEAAKALVALSRTKLGLEYLRYLISCETAIPKMIQEIAELRSKIDALERPKRIKTQKVWRIVVGYRTERALGLEGITDVKIPVYREISVDNMTDEERRIWEAQHLARISSGASTKAAKLLNREIEPGGKRGKLIVMDDKRPGLLEI